MTLRVIFHANKRKHICAGNKNIFPNRDVILFYYLINLVIISSTKCIKFNIPNM